MFVQITQEFAEANKGYENGNNVFNYAVTKDGRFVCAENSIKEFPELFKEQQALGWIGLPEELNAEDFPAPEIDED